MISKTTFTALMLFMLFFSNAQNSISGTVKDNAGEPLAFANVVLYGAHGSITGMASSEDGIFSFIDLTDGAYQVEVSMLGFKVKKSEEIVVSEGNRSQTLNFSLELETLDEVVVTQKRPVIRQTAEKLIVDLETSELVNTNLEDVMKKVPGVLVRNGSLSYAGQSNLRILINGKTTDFMDVNTLLRELPAENIAKVELVQQPGAEYDAEGSGPLINIILKKNVKLGTYGSIRSTLGYVEDVLYGTSVSLASYKNQLNWQLGAGYSRWSWRDDLFLSRKVLDETYDQASISPFDPESLRANARIDYYIDGKHTIGTGVNRIQSMSDRVTKNSTTISDATSTETLFTDNSFDRDRTTLILNPYYEFDDEKNKLTLDFNYVDYTYGNVNNLFQIGESTIDYDNQRYFQDATYEVLTYSGDYKRTINDDFSVSFGSRFTDVTSDSDLQSLTQNGQGAFVNNMDQTNRFVIDEEILAFYGKVNAELGDNWSFSGGLRWEESKTIGTSVTQSETRARNISKFFPSASLSRKITNALGADLSYSYRIQRPDYGSLNSFVYFYDPFTFEEGNPNLKPAFTNSYQFSLTYEEQPFFSVSYREVSDALFQVVTQNDASAETSRSVINLANYNNLSFSFFGPLNFIDGLEGYTGVIVNYNEYRSENLSPELNLDKWALTWFTSAEYTLPWEVNAELSGWYSTGGLEGQIDYDWLAGMDIAVSKKLLNDRLKVAVEFEEILNKTFQGSINYNNVNATVESDWARQNVFLQLSYSFGSKFGKQKRRGNASKEIQDRINDNN